MKSETMVNRKVVTRFGVVLKPAALVLEFLDHGKTYVKTIRLRNIDALSCEETCLKLQSKFPQYINSHSIDPLQLEAIIEKIITANKVAAVQPAKTGGTMMFKPMQANQLSQENIANLDLNTCSEELNQKAKQLMSVEFEAKRLKPGDEGYVYDKVVDFEAPTEAADWDDEDD